METASESLISVNTTREPMPGGAADDGQIVVIRPQVIDNVGHVLGNMFQRIYHLIERTHDGDGSAVGELESGIRRLEGLLQLLIEYVLPRSLSMEYVSISDVAQSLAQQVGCAVGSPVKLEGDVPGGGRLLADAGCLARAFGLLGSQLHPESGCATAVRFDATARNGARSLTLRVAIPDGCRASRSSTQEVQWSVAEKLLEMHGGTLQESSTDSGEVTWEIMLPLQ